MLRNHHQDTSPYRHDDDDDAGCEMKRILSSIRLMVAIQKVENWEPTKTNSSSSSRIVAIHGKNLDTNTATTTNHHHTKTGKITVKVRNSVPVVKSASASDSSID